MLKKVSFKNYRCFENSTLDFRDLSIIVGNNNAGKSTIIEALRIIGDITRRFKHCAYRPAPTVLNLPILTKGIYIDVDSLRINLRTVVYQYRNDVFAQISAYFDDSITINAYLSTDIAYAVVTQNGQTVTSKSRALKINDLDLFIMPQITLIRKEEENRITDDTIKRGLSSYLSSSHFRNELYLYRDQHFHTFTETAQTTWPGLRIEDLSYDFDSNKIALMVIDDDYAAEIGMMGSGLQMWLQIIWFISRCPASATVVLDEPDVYMHPDLQKRILQIVQNRFRQVIIATHSIEIISGVEPDQIVTVDRKSRRMHYAGNFRAVQEVINNLGSNHNLSLSRLGSVKKCIFVEGEDIKTLTKFQDILYPDSRVSLNDLPVVPLGGWSRFNEALGAARLFYDETNGDIQTYCLLDRDYHTEDEVQALYEKANASHLNLHVWKRKEIENYVLTAESVFRVSNATMCSFEEFTKRLFLMLDSLREETLDSIMDCLSFSKMDRSKSPSYYHKQAEDFLSAKWTSLEGRLSVVNGKSLISSVNSWLKSIYKISCSKSKLINALKPDDLPDEVKEVISVLLNGTKFRDKYNNTPIGKQ